MKRKSKEEKEATREDRLRRAALSPPRDTSLGESAKYELQKQVPQSRKVFHTENSASLLSTEAPPQNYRGIVNVMVLVMLFTHLRLIIENILKYGLLVNFSSTYVGWSSTIIMTAGYNVFIALAVIIEQLVQKKRITDKQCIAAHVMNCATMLAVPIAFIEYSDALPGTGLIVLFTGVIFWMKLISWAHSNYQYREALKSGKELYEEVKDCEKLVKYPNNLNYANMYYFIACPSLVYQLNYPRSPKIRPLWLAKRCIELIICNGFAYFLVEQYLLPTVRNSLDPLQHLDIPILVERLMKLSISNLYIWLLGFYSFFHLWLNILAELLRFGDRNFYGPWWNCTTMDVYWRIWNIPTHNWLIKHIHIPLIQSGVPKAISNIAVFIVSAVFHELLVSVPVHTFRAWAFFGMMGNIPLIFITRAFFQGSQIGNAIFWLSFCFMGQPLAVLLYYNDYYLKYHS